MMKRIALIALLVCVVLPACSDDDPVRPVDNSPYKNLSTPDNVLFNLELAYNERDLAEYQRLLDDHFAFFTSAGDVFSGLPVQWARTDEMAIHTALFDPNYSGSAPRCTGIKMDLTLDGVEWNEVPAGPETWYTAIVSYDFQVDMDPDYTFITGPGSQAEIAVRNAGSAGSPRWQIVEMKDRGSDGGMARVSGATQQMTWGRLKAMYPRAFGDLSEKWHVLQNVEKAYNQRDLDGYGAVLDPNFIFFLSAGDVGNGLPEWWSRSVEYQVHQQLFSPAPTTGPRAKSIKLDIDWELDPFATVPQPKNLAWLELPGSGPLSDETWYVVTVYYSFQIAVDPDLTYYNAPGSRVQFTVRNAGTVDAPRWMLVEMRDIGAMRALVTALAATEQSSWGQVKALYRD